MKVEIFFGDTTERFIVLIRLGSEVFFFVEMPARGGVFVAVWEGVITLWRGGDHKGIVLKGNHLFVLLN